MNKGLEVDMTSFHKFNLYVVSIFIFCLPAITVSARGHAHEAEHGNHNKAAFSQHNEQHNNYNQQHSNLNHNQNINRYNTQNLNKEVNRVNPNQLYGPHGYNYGNYGGGGGGYAITPNPYPADGSQPGMSDDSNALYQSQLQKRGDSY